MSRFALLSLAALSPLVGCDAEGDSGAMVDDTGAADTGADASTADFDCPPPTAAECGEDYGFCGSLKVPTDFVGTPRSLAIALYETIPPAGPPNATLAEIDAPELLAGSCYTVEIHPMLEQGTYYLWANLYMEGGGEWVPVSGVDYTAASEAPLELDGSATVFEDLTLELAAGW